MTERLNNNVKVLKKTFIHLNKTKKSIFTYKESYKVKSHYKKKAPYVYIMMLIVYKP